MSEMKRIQKSTVRGEVSHFIPATTVNKNLDKFDVNHSVMPSVKLDLNMGNSAFLYIDFGWPVNTNMGT